MRLPDWGKIESGFRTIGETYNKVQTGLNTARTLYDTAGTYSASFRDNERSRIAHDLRTLANDTLRNQPKETLASSANNILLKINSL
jgi:DNA anti-recombination protein RmuC